MLYHSPVDAMEQTASATSEEQAKGMELWMNWAQKCGGHLVDMGAPLMNGQVLSVDGSSKSSTKDVRGYSIIEAENMDEVKKLLQGNPNISGWNADATIEVHEPVALPGCNQNLTLALSKGEGTAAFNVYYTSCPPWFFAYSKIHKLPKKVFRQLVKSYRRKVFAV